MYKDTEIQKKAVYLLQNSKRQAFRALKSGPCTDCGVSYPYYVMQFDHVHGKKKYNLSHRSASFGSKEFMEELAKCELVCANCHAERTHQRITRYANG